MKLLKAFIMGALISCASFASDGPIRLIVNPTNLVLHLGQPAAFALGASNISDMPVKGIFVPIQNGFAGLSVEISDPSGDKYLFAHDEVVDDIYYNEVILKPGETLKSSIIILYDMAKDRHVFNRPGKYTLSFVLQWKWQELHRTAVRTTVQLEVLDRDEELSHLPSAARRLWMDKDIAYAFQTDSELSDSSLERLRKLAEEYPETVYGKLALDLLEREKKR